MIVALRRPRTEHANLKDVRRSFLFLVVNRNDLKSESFWLVVIPTDSEAEKVVVNRMQVAAENVGRTSTASI